MSGVGCLMAEDRGQMAEDRGQMAEVGGRMSEDRCRVSGFWDKRISQSSQSSQRKK